MLSSFDQDFQISGRWMDLVTPGKISWSDLCGQ